MDINSYDQDYTSCKSKYEDLVGELEKGIDDIEYKLEQNKKNIIQELKEFVQHQVLNESDDNCLTDLKNSIDQLKILTEKLYKIENIFSGFHNKSTSIFSGCPIPLNESMLDTTVAYTPQTNTTCNNSPESNKTNLELQSSVIFEVSDDITHLKNKENTNNSIDILNLLQYQSQDRAQFFKKNETIKESAHMISTTTNQSKSSSINYKNNINANGKFDNLMNGY